MKPAHTRTKPLKGPSARNAQMPPRTSILKERAITCVMTYLPCNVLCGGAALRMTSIVAVLSLQAQIQHNSDESFGRYCKSASNRDLGSRRRGSLIYTSFCRYGLSEDHIATTPHDINRFRIAALSLDEYAAGLAYMAGLAHDAGQSAYDLFKNYPQSPA